MNIFKEQTKRMMEILQETKSINAVCDFYAQLSNIRPINSLSVINALHAGEMDSSKLISESVTYREWMRHIKLKDIRNHTLFTIWKENQTIVSEHPYYGLSINDENYHKCYDPKADISMGEVGNLLETCFYIRQVCAIKEMMEDEFDDLSIINDPEWDMYPNWLSNLVNEKGLTVCVYENFKLIEPLIMTHQ